MTWIQGYISADVLRWPPRMSTLHCIGAAALVILAAPPCSALFTGCTGQSGGIREETWNHIRDVQRMDAQGRKFGMSLDPRSDSLESLRQLLKEEVLPDFSGAVRDCAFGVLSLLLLTLPLTDAEEGIDKAREMQALADQLMFQFSEYLPEADWPVDPSSYYQNRLLLGLQPHNCTGTALRIYVYNSTRDLTRRRLRTGVGMMAAASHVHAFIDSGTCRTEDAEAADLFLIPAYHGEQYDEFLEVRVHSSNVSTIFPYLTRRRGVDHFFVVSANLPSWPHLEPLRNTVALTVESYQVNDGVARWYSPWKDVMIPGYIDRWRIAAMRSFSKPTHERGYILVFHGNHPGTHHLYVKHHANVRTTILESFAGLPDCSVGGPVPDFFDRMGRSHFCLVPRGSSAWTIHLYESFFFGCIPVILSDYFEMPFQDLVDWPALSIKWPADQVGLGLLDHLRSIPLTRVAEMKRRLEEASCYFDYHRGWLQEQPGSPKAWVQWGRDVVALSGDCPFCGHGDAATLEACKVSCAQNPVCNVVNFWAAPAGDDQDLAGAVGQCVHRRCEDPAQPALTGQAAGWEVWAHVGKEGEDAACSPFSGIFRTLERRVQERPPTYGPSWV